MWFAVVFFLYLCRSTSQESNVRKPAWRAGSLIDEIVIIIITQIEINYYPLEWLLLSVRIGSYAAMRITMKEHKSITHVYGWKATWSEMNCILCTSEIIKHFFTNGSLVVQLYLWTFP